MATGQSFGFLEKSSNGIAKKSVSSLDTTEQPTLIGRGVRALSSPAILQLTKGQLHYQDNGNPEEHITRSCPHPLSETTLLNPNSEPSEHEESDQRNGGEETGDRWSYCIDILDKCLDSIVQFRNSKQIHVVQALYLLLPMSAIIMGVKYADRCPYLPIFSGIIGVVGAIFIGLWITMTVFQQRGTPCLEHQKFVIGFIFVTLVFLVAIDTSLVSQMQPSFTEGDKNYCDKMFYHYSIRKVILTGAAFGLAAIFYLPRSRHYLCCCNCCSSQPPHYNVQYLSI